MSDDFQTLFDYIGLLETELKEADPERFSRLTQQREKLLPVLQKQRQLIGLLEKRRETDQACISALEAQIVLLLSQQKAGEVQRQDVPNAGKK